MSGSPAKRPRYSGSFSPASPPYHLAKPIEEAKTFVAPPPTPPSSTLYIPASQHFHDTPGTTAHQSEMTPPSSVAMSSHLSQTTASATSNTSPLLSTNTLQSKPENWKDGNTDVQMMDSIPDVTEGGEEDASLRSSAAHRRSDHERSELVEPDSMEHAPRRLSKEVKNLFKLCESPLPVARPHPSQNLMRLYGLESIAASVARRDPVTGEKINRLRKSYEGKVKSFHIAGKNRAVLLPQELTNLIQYPDEEWYNQKVFNKEIPKEMSAPFLAKLERAVQLKPAPLPKAENERWKSILGSDEVVVKPKVLSENIGKDSNVPPTNVTQPHDQAAVVASPAMKSTRPDRTGKKRSYRDSSFKGYGEGFVDDDPIGDSAAEDDMKVGGPKKRRRKDYSGSGSIVLNERGASLGLGMVGVGNTGYR